MKADLDEQRDALTAEIQNTPRILHAAQMIRIEATLLQEEAPGASPLKQTGRNILIAINDAIKAHEAWEEQEKLAEIERLLG
jgi:hypothetical protein